jgi:hypothetical protein
MRLNYPNLSLSISVPPDIPKVTGESISFQIADAPKALICRGNATANLAFPISMSLLAEDFRPVQSNSGKGL